jgi:hypothetical protein
MYYDQKSNTWVPEGQEPPAPAKLTKCPTCGEESVKYTQQAYGDQWDCTRPGCGYKHYYSLGD